MLALLSFCSFPWWLAWLLPFLLGLLLGWALWSKWKNMYMDLQGSGRSDDAKVSKLEADLKASRSQRTTLENKISKLEGELKSNKSKLSSLTSSAASFAAGAATAEAPKFDLDIKALKADVDVLEEKRKSLESRVLTLTEERNDLKSKYDEVNDSFAKYKAAHEAENSTTEAVVDQDDWEGKYLRAVADIKQKEDMVAAKESEIVRIKDRFSDVDKKISSAEREATEWKIKYNALKQNMTGTAATVGTSALVSAAQPIVSETAKEEIVEAITPSEVEEPKAPVVAKVPSAYSKIKEDNLQIIEGIGPKMESVLHENEVPNFATLASKETSDIQAILDKYGDKYRIIDPSSWVQQAQMADAKKWDELVDFQKQLNSTDAGANGLSDSKLEKYLIKIGALKQWKQDDLKAIEGIGPAIEKLLHEGGIMTWKQLSKTSVERIKELLDAAGARFKLADPTTWPKQAEMAAEGRFDELQEYQDFLDGGKE